MSFFRDLTASAAQSHTEVFAEDVGLWNPGDADATPIKAVLRKRKTVSRRDDQGRTQRVTILPIRFPTLTTINHLAKIEIDGEKLSIESVGKLTAHGLMVDLRIGQVEDVSRPGYRGRPS